MGEVVMKSRSESVVILAVLGLGLALPSPVRAMIARDIEAKTEALRDARASGSELNREQVDALEKAIERGQQASAGLRGQIDSLEKEKAALERIQVVLTSGLI